MGIGLSAAGALLEARGCSRGWNNVGPPTETPNFLFPNFLGGAVFQVDLVPISDSHPPHSKWSRAPQKEAKDASFGPTALGGLPTKVCPPLPLIPMFSPRHAIHWSHNFPTVFTNRPSQGHCCQNGNVLPLKCHRDSAWLCRAGRPPASLPIQIIGLPPEAEHPRAAVAAAGNLNLIGTSTSRGTLKRYLGAAFQGYSALIHRGRSPVSRYRTRVTDHGGRLRALAFDLFLLVFVLLTKVYPHPCFPWALYTLASFTPLPADQLFDTTSTSS